MIYPSMTIGTNNIASVRCFMLDEEFEVNCCSDGITIEYGIIPQIISFINSKEPEAYIRCKLGDNLRLVRHAYYIQFMLASDYPDEDEYIFNVRVSTEYLNEFVIVLKQIYAISKIHVLPLDIPVLLDRLYYKLLANGHNKDYAFDFVDLIRNHVSNKIRDYVLNAYLNNREYWTYTEYRLSEIHSVAKSSGTTPLDPPGVMRKTKWSRGRCVILIPGVRPIQKAVKKDMVFYDF